MAKDTPTGGGAWVKEHGEGGEVFNFKRARNEYFGYVQPTGAGINLGKLGATADDEELDGVTVAWVATHPTEGGMRIVGWYRNATVFREFQAPVATKGREFSDGKAPWFLVRAKDAVLLERDERVFEVPRGKGGMGRSNVWYPGAGAAAPILKYIGAGGRIPSSAKPKSAPKLQDVERRLRIEQTAMKAAAKWFADRGYDVDDVSMERVGWDLEARLRRAHLKIEVKGTSLDVEDFIIEVTPNEYGKMTSDEHRATYRLCVVTSCEDAPLVTVFAWSDETKTWGSGDGSRHLVIEERVAARISAAT
ncbi:protein NO VEIN domain-containing protein [Corallococcus exercitus]|uniref:protein NO VEIN domain-containing protein n=1 Tax=Corallococcus exercitus TaxID=2316736 RepID=UPI0035D4E36A